MRRIFIICASLIMIGTTVVWTGGSAMAVDGCNDGSSSSSVLISGGAPPVVNYSDAWRFRAKRDNNAGRFYVRSYDKGGVLMTNQTSTYQDLYIGYWNVNFPRLADKESIENDGATGVFLYDRWCTKA